MAKDIKTKTEKRQSVHYVNNKEFSTAVVDYVRRANEAAAEGRAVPQIPNYIGECFVKITEGLSHKPNFIRYSYRDEMVMDAQENCVKAIMNFNLNKATRTGLPNAFAYFTQIAYYAFLRRIAKEKKQWEIKMKYIESAAINAFADFGMEDGEHSGDSLIAKIRNRTDSIRHRDVSFIQDDSDKPAKKGRSSSKPKETSTLDLLDSFTDDD